MSLSDDMGMKGVDMAKKKDDKGKGKGKKKGGKKKK
jgi:hypothetical protein